MRATTSVGILPTAGNSAHDGIHVPFSIARVQSLQISSAVHDPERRHAPTSTPCLAKVAGLT
jgi:hypothetical protein